MTRGITRGALAPRSNNNGRDRRVSPQENPPQQQPANMPAPPPTLRPAPPPQAKQQPPTANTPARQDPPQKSAGPVTQEATKPTPKLPTPTTAGNPAQSPQTEAAVKQFPRQTAKIAAMAPRKPPVTEVEPSSPLKSPGNIQQPGNTKENIEHANGNAEEKESEEQMESEPMEASDSTTKKRKNLKHRSGVDGSMGEKRIGMDPLAIHKIALVALNKLKPGLKYTVDSMEGPSHNPKFTVSVEVDNQKYFGKGRSKREAKHAAAQAALNFTSAILDGSQELHGVPKLTGLQPISPSHRVYKLLAAGENNPVTLLNEIHPVLEHFFVKEINISTMRFNARIKVNNRTFEGRGQSKKQAKAAAARAVLSSIYDLAEMKPMSSPSYDDSQGHLEPLSQAEIILEI